MGCFISTFSKPSDKYYNILEFQNDDKTKETNIVIQNSAFSAAFGSGISYCHEKVLDQLNLEPNPTKFKSCHGLKCHGEIKLTMQLENANFNHIFIVVNESPVDFFIGDDFLKSLKSITILSADKTMTLTKLQSPADRS